MERRRTHEAGVGLVEVLISLVVFLIAGGGVVAAHWYSHGLSVHATDTMKAVNDLEDLMERIHATPFNNLLTRFPPGIPNGVAGNEYTALVGGYTLEDEQITVTYPTQAPGRVEILATATWIHQGRACSTSLSTVRTSP